MVCEVGVTNTNVFLCACMYGSAIAEILFTYICKQGESADELQLFTQIWFHKLDI